MSRILKTWTVLAILLMLVGCSSSQEWGWYVIDPTIKRGQINLKFLMSGIPWTILLTICCVVISNVVGFLSLIHI